MSYTRARGHALHLAVADRPADVLRVMLWLFFPGPVWLRERYQLRSAGQSWAWIVVHPLVVLREGLHSLRALLR